MPLRYRPDAGVPLRYALCGQTVTVYHVTFGPFRCRRTVLRGVYWGLRRNWDIQKTGAQEGAGLLLVIPQKAGARVPPATAS